MLENKLKLNGLNAFSNVELLASLLPKQDTRLATEILEYCDWSGLKLLNLSYFELIKFKGVNKQRALGIVAAFKLYQNAQLEQINENESITSSEIMFKYLKPQLAHLENEECWIVYLNRANKPVGMERISIGGMSSTIMDTKLIIKHALLRNACGLIIAHNHPSHTPKPGNQDKQQTKKLKRACESLDISVLDHIIIAGDQYYSFCDSGML